MQWVLNKAVFDNEERYLEAQGIIKSFGDTYALIDNPWLDYDTYIIEKENICMGSLSLLKEVKKVALYPFEVIYYSRFLKKEYINYSSLLIPFWKYCDEEFRNAIFSLYENSLFIKPNKGTKSFTGYCPKKEEFELDKKTVLGGLEDTSLILISNKVNLSSYEYRLYVVNNKIVTASSYSWEDIPYIDVPEEVIKYGEKIIKEMNFKDKNDNLITTFTLDICKDKDSGKYYVVDINNLYTSGTYNCDLRKLLGAIKNENTLTQSL